MRRAIARLHAVMRRSGHLSLAATAVMISYSEQPFNGRLARILNATHRKGIVIYAFFSKYRGRLRSAVA